MRLDGQVAIVTGGAVRLGRAIALALAEAGAKIGLHYGTSAADADETLEAVRSAGSDAVAIQADLNGPREAARTIVESTIDSFSRADILVNSAAIFESGTLATTSDEEWDRHFNVNLKAPFFLCQAFAQRLAAQQRGHIVNIADWRATRPGTDHLAYTLTKSALVTLTKILAQQLAPNVQVNAIAPGAILPPPGRDDEHLERLAERIPLRRTGTPEEVTRTLMYLLGSDFITGEVVHVTGGEHL